MAQLRAIAELWGLEPPRGPAARAAQWLSAAMLEHAAEYVASLPPDAQPALEAILRDGGRAPMEELNRRYGPLREMGPGRRDRERPDRSPASPLEMLWYRGLLSRAFADSADGPREFGFVPDDLLRALPPLSEASSFTLDPVEASAGVVSARLAAVDDSATVLAALRLGGDRDVEPFMVQPRSRTLLETLLADLGAVPPAAHQERVAELLRTEPGETLEALLGAWKTSTTWNDLSLVDDLAMPGDEWPNEPLAGRTALLELLQGLGTNHWWSIDDFVEAVKEHRQGFLRAPGGFESWYLLDRQSGDFLRGFEHWDRIEGAFLRAVIVGPLYWLGAADLDSEERTFRLNDRFYGPVGADSLAGRARVTAEGRVHVGRNADRALRYQVARFCRWESMDPGGYTYQLTAAALEQANEQGLTAEHAREVLTSLSEGFLPDGIARSLRRWSGAGQQARLEAHTVLRVSEPAVLDTLQASPETRRYIIEVLGPREALVRGEHRRRLVRAALRAGLLIGD